VINARVARLFFAATAGIAFAGLILLLILTATADGGSFASAQARVLNSFCFFTVQSNIVVAITSAMLAIRLGRPTMLFRVFRIVGVIAIAVTGLVFYIALRGTDELAGWKAVANFLLHVASPILSTIGWVVFGPRRQLSWKVIRFAAVPPFLWLVFTLVRGAFVQDVNGRDYYPYPFMNVEEHGYAVVIINCALVVALFFGLCAAAKALDGKLPASAESGGS
jgi:hypothetical protein